MENYGIIVFIIIMLVTVIAVWVKEYNYYESQEKKRRGSCSLAMYLSCMWL